MQSFNDDKSEHKVRKHRMCTTKEGYRYIEGGGWEIKSSSGCSNNGGKIKSTKIEMEKKNTIQSQKREVK